MSAVKNPWPVLLPPPQPIIAEDFLRYRLIEQSPQASLLACGDWGAVREFEQAYEQPPEVLYGPFLPHIRGADFSIVNLELPLARGQEIIKDGPVFYAPPSSAESLRTAGFQGVSLANNHMRDQGADAAAKTRAVCAAAGLAVVGAGADRAEAFAPLIVERAGLKIGILALAEPGDAVVTALRGGSADINDPLVPWMINDLRPRCDVLVVIAHGGVEYSPYPPPYWKQQLSALIAYGADAVIAHHPHIPQGMSLVERTGRSPAPILWSLGNFIFPGRVADRDKPPLMDKGLVARLHLAQGSVVQVDLLPYHIVNGRGLQGFDQQGLVAWQQFIAGLSQELVDEQAYQGAWQQLALRSWRVHARERVQGLTEKLCRNDPLGLRHGQSHFASPAHYQLYATAIAGIIEQCPEDPAQQARIEAWYRGEWPVSLPAGRP